MTPSWRALALLLVAGALLVSIVPLVHAHDVARAALYDLHCPLETVVTHAVGLVTAPAAANPVASMLLLPAPADDDRRTHEALARHTSRAPPSC